MTIGFDGLEFPAPTDWQKFERLCCDLWAAMWGDPNTQPNGRSGQEQAGVDVFGRRGSDQGYSGVQCKRRGNTADSAEISEDELRAEVAKARTFRPPIAGEFVLAFTGKRDAKIQAVARTITQEHYADGLFAVTVYSWDDIQEKFGTHPEVWMKHYSGYAATVAAMMEDVACEPTWGTGNTSALLQRRDRAGSVIVAQTSASLDAEYLAEIQLIRNALKEGHARLALSQAESLRGRIWSAANGDSRAGVLILLGHAHYALGDEQQAGKLLVEALDHRPTDASVQSQAAFGHSLLGNDEAAKLWARRALDQNPADILAIQVAAQHDPRTDEDVLAAYEAFVGKRPELYSILGHRAARRLNFSSARIWFEKAIATDPEQPEFLAAAGEAIISMVADDVSAHIHEGPNTHVDLVRAIKLLEDAISRLADDDVRRARGSWYASRVTAKRMLRSPDVASAADEALQACGRQADLIRLRAAVASDAGDHRRVVSLLKELAPPRDADEIGLLAAALGNLGELEDSTSLWLELLARDDLSEHTRHEAQQNYVFALLMQRREADARATVSSYLEATPGSLSGILIAVATYERLCEAKARDQFLDRAVVVAADGSAYFLLQLGDALMRAERWSDAAEIYGRAVRPGSGDAYGRRRLHALYKAGLYHTALKESEGVVTATGNSRFLAEYRSAIYEELGDLDRAVEVCRSFLTLEPKCSPIELRLALVLQRKGDLPESERILDKLDVQDIDDIESACILARTLLRLDRPDDALDVAFRMRQRHLNDVNAHLRYVSLYMLAKGKHDQEERSEVTLESAVYLTGSGAPGWILLRDSDEADLNQKEYSRQHALTVGLLGKTVGARISIGCVEEPWTVAAIGTKYGFALARTIELFPSHFPANREIQQFQVKSDTGDEVVEDLKRRLQQGDPRREAALSQYAAGRCTIGCVATVLGRSNIEAVATVASSPSGLICTTNALEERNASHKLLADVRRPLLLDLTAILTLDTVGMLLDGTLAHRALVVAQKTIDELAGEQLRWQTTDDGGSMSIGVDGDNLIRYQTTADDVAHFRRHYHELLEWLRSQAQIMSVPSEVAERYACHDQFGDLIGDCYWDSIRIATGPSVVLLSDDLWLRHLAANVVAVQGACSAQLLMAEFEAGRLSNERYTEAIVRLIATGYRKLSVNASILECAARMDQWRTGHVFMKVLSAIRGPDTTLESAVLVGAEFMRVIILNVVLAPQRSALLSAVLEALVAGRDAMAVLRLLRSQVPRFLALHPLASDEVLGTIAVWERISVGGVMR